MAFSSLPLYNNLDPQNNWHQQSNDQIQLQTYHDSPSELPPPSNQAGVGGSGGSTATTGSIKPNSMVDRARQAQLPLPEPGLKCPRCDSSNTKFCYFNNYNLSQPRHFCKTCRRYWTRGGSLRNVPVGGGSRRTAKRSKGSRSSGSRSSPATISVTSNVNSSGVAGNPCSTSLFLSHNNLQTPTLHQLPFLPSLHSLGLSSPSAVGLNFLGAPGGSEGEFPNLLASFEGLGRFNGTHPFENSNSGLIGHSLQSKPFDADLEVVDRVASVKTEDGRGLNSTKDFAVDHQFNWNTNLWTNGDLSGFASPSSASHHLLR